jgi:transcriptional regulator of acetoin/glycerol metabolism
VVLLADLPAALARRDDDAPNEPLADADAALRDDLAARLRANGNNVTHVAREMGKARQQVQRWVKRFGLKAR